MCCAVQIEEPSALFTALQSMVRDPSFDPQRAYSVARRRREDAMAEIEALLGVESIEYWQFRCAYLKNVFLVCAPCHTVLLSLHRVASCCAMLIWVVPCCTVLYALPRLTLCCDLDLARCVGLGTDCTSAPSTIQSERRLSSTWGAAGQRYDRWPSSWYLSI